MKSLSTKEQPRLLGFEPAAGGGRESAPSGVVRRPKPVRPDVGANSDLIGRGFQDREERVVVTEVSRANPAHVIVRRERDGHSWTIPAGIVRMILPPARRRAA